MLVPAFVAGTYLIGRCGTGLRSSRKFFAGKESDGLGQQIPGGVAGAELLEQTRQ